MPVLKKAYYLVKPIIPRRLQIAMRRLRARIKLRTDGHAWPIDEKAGGHPKNWQGWPDRKRFAFVMTHDVETEVGRDRCLELMRLDQEYGIVSSFNFVPERYDVSKELREHLVRHGFEIGIHDLKHDGKLFTSRSKFFESAKLIMQTPNPATAHSSQRPACRLSGWRVRISPVITAPIAGAARRIPSPSGP